MGPVIVSLQVIGLIVSKPHPGLHGVGLAVSISLAVFAVGVYGAMATRSGPKAVCTAFVVVLLIGCVALARFQPQGPGILGLFVAVALVSRRLPASGASAVAGTVLMVIVISAPAKREHQPLAELMTGIAMVSFYAVTRLALRLSQTNEQAEQLLVELEQSREAQARAAALAERQRLAREMHDILAHSLSGLMLQLEGARMLACSDRVDERLPETIDRAHHLAKSGLDESRQAIRMLRDETLPGPDELPALTSQFQRDTGIMCELSVVGEPHPLSPEARLAVYRVTQESLTNVAKHAQATHVEVLLAYENDHARLVVKNDAESTGLLQASSVESAPEVCGYGLAGMRERAELLGGRLSAVTTQTGFRVELEVPA